MESTYTLILINGQGASEETRDLETTQDVINQIDTWADPETMTARVHDSDGVCLYDGPADEYEITERDAQEVASKVLSGRDTALDGQWREAGCRSALDAATALVGHGYSAEVTKRAAQIVAAEIEG